ncbi:hypothetical protein JCM17844_06830 [Iodidimonas gelatinilytica]|uniref:Uncharacterized protein n=1 Tax=Iodidimonas gelatinilytica TaxID=1236966 RepID=A0A5A7MMH4_9PROT|nr:hypothetical protein JCM17844_06830 [Iodidimonas gelatinilytica]
MSDNTTSLRQWLAQNWFWLALIVVVFFGYQIGKDRAIAQNTHDTSGSFVNGGDMENDK